MGFADLQGVDPGTVTKWLKSGVIDETEDGRIQWQKASRKIEKAADPFAGKRRKGERSDDVKATTDDVEVDLDPESVSEARGRYTIAKAKREEERARLSEMQRLEEEGRLVDAHEMTMELADILAILRQRLRVIPNRMAPELPADTVRRLTTEIDDALHGCADAIEEMGE